MNRNLFDFPPVDVIVPVYRGLEQTRRCLESVLAAGQATSFELVLIDDCSPDPELRAYLASLGDRPRVTLLVNERNVGFVATVNRGMVLHPDRDVVLLNSDTEVANDWLDRLRRCAYSQEEIGTVTPFSNNATICSYPEFCMDNDLPLGISVPELDDWFARINAGGWIEIPTAVGFCMYIKRACLDQVGLFDVESFGRGYGEENDFSLRAEKVGWHNVLAADTFVYHAGGASFGKEREHLQAQAAEILRNKHPGFDERVQRFIRADPPAALRRAVLLEMEAFRQRRALGYPDVQIDAVEKVGKPVQLHVVHDLGGGVEQWLRDFCQADRLRSNLVLRPYSHSAIFGQGLALYAHPWDQQPLHIWLFAHPITTVTVAHPEYGVVLEHILAEFNVGTIIVSSLIGHSMETLRTGLPTLLVCHDYFPYCPAINIYFKGICSECDARRLEKCYLDNPEFNPFQNFPPEERLHIREQYLDLLTAGKLTVVAPSYSVFANLVRLNPRFQSVPHVVIPHGYGVCFSPLEFAQTEGGRLKILVLGMLANSKGLPLLLDVADRISQFADLYLLGSGELGDLFVGRPGVHVLGAYDRENLANIVSNIAPDVGLLMSVCPETFSYTLGELLMMAIPPVVTSTGSFRERVRHGETGFLYEPNGASMLAILGEIDADRSVLHRVRANLREIPPRSARAMVAEFHRLLPLGGWRSQPMEGGSNVISIKDAWLIALVVDLSSKWKDVKSLHLKLGVKDARLVQMEQRVRSLEEGLHQKEQLILGQQAQIDGLYASTSWRVSLPVRIFGRRVRQLLTLTRCLRPVLQRPASIPSRVNELCHAWHSGGSLGLKQSLLQWQTVLPSQSPPKAVGTPPLVLAPEGEAVQVGWHQSVFQKYRESLTETVRAAIQSRIQSMASPPLISVLVPTYNTPEPMLREMLASVCAQFYPHWQLCIADDGSSEPQVRAVLEEYAVRDARIRLDFSAQNGGVSHATNRALGMAEGEFVVLLDHDDLLEEQALFRVAEAVLEDDPDMLYSDEVLVGENGQALHFVFRPMFSPEYLRAHPYIVHLIGFRTSILRGLGGLDESLRISQDYDLILRVSEQARKVTHIPEMLYRWRTHGGSAGHAMIQKVVEASSLILGRHLQRCGEEGVVGEGKGFNFYDVRYPLAHGLKVAILIPTKNHADLVRACIESIERTARDVNHEIVLIDHDSDDSASLAYFESLKSRVRVLRYSGPFNFSTINNWAAAQLDGNYTHYLFCNNDIEAIMPGWLYRMLELGQKPDVGVVGAKLYYPDRKTIQHAGVVVPCCGVAENLGRFLVTHEDSNDQGYNGSLVCNHEVSAVTAACMLVRADVFKMIGGFDEAIAVGFGDVDFCLRVRETGNRVLFCAHAELVHHESYTRGRSQRDPHPKDTAYFLKKWQHVLDAGDPYFNPNLSAHSPNWQVAEPLEFRLDVDRRSFVRGACG